MNKDSKIYVAGNRGLVGSAIVRLLNSRGYVNILSTPSSHWDVIYFLDARKWIDDYYILYRIPLKRTSEEWRNIKMNKTQTFEDQTNQGRRPRINWESLYPQIESHCNKVYEGNFEDIFILC